MIVVATRLGYYGIKRYREGDVFKIKDEKAFSSKWMKKADGYDEPEDEDTDVIEEIIKPRRGRKAKAMKSQDDIIEESQNRHSDDDVI